MQLVTKPDFDEVTRRWGAFWAGDVLDRPMVCAQVSKGKDLAEVNLGGGQYWNLCHGEYEKQLDLLDVWAENTLFMGDLIPYVSPDHGPDQFGAWLGSRLKFNPDSRSTNWAEPTLIDWESFLPVSLHEDNESWQSALTFSTMLKERGAGKYIVGMADLHSHMDAFSALRHPDRLCMDLYDQPELVLRACAQARTLYPQIYEKLYTAGGMTSETGTVGWLPMWCEAKTASVQCDFSVFLGKDLWRRFVLPSVEAEVNYLDHCFYHLDGKQQLIHLDDLLALPKLDGIQWVPGAGEPEMFLPCWRGVLKKILGAGKKVIVYGKMDLDAVKDVHRDLGPGNVVYQLFDSTREELEQILNWLERQ